MNYDEVERTAYSGEVWAAERRPSAALARLLTARDRLIVLLAGGPPFQAVLGVPHHAAVGEENICERATGKHRNRVSDDGAASYALVAFMALKERGLPCKLVVMAHPTTHNPNKTVGSPYWREILKDDAGLLLECHGSAPGPHDLELSAGRNHLADPVSFGRVLSTALGDGVVLGIQKQAGQARALVLGPTGESEGRLRNPALKTDSLVEAGRRGVAALHLEATPRFRLPEDGSDTVTPDGLMLGRAIAETVSIQVTGTCGPILREMPSDDHQGGRW